MNARRRHGFASLRSASRRMLVSVLLGCGGQSQPEPQIVQMSSVLSACLDDGSCPWGRTCSRGLCIFDRTAEIRSSEAEPREFLGSVERRVWDAVKPDADGRIRCPGASGQPSVDTGMTPPETVSCARDVDQRCVPGGSGPGGYPVDAWRHPTWVALGIHVAVPHQFHYRFVAGPVEGQPDTCAFTTQAFGDLDDDGTWSTYERSGLQNPTGPNAAAGLYIDRPFE